MCGQLAEAPGCSCLSMLFRSLNPASLSLRRLLCVLGGQRGVHSAGRSGQPQPSRIFYLYACQAALCFQNGEIQTSTRAFQGVSVPRFQPERRHAGRFRPYDDVREVGEVANVTAFQQRHWSCQGFRAQRGVSAFSQRILSPFEFDLLYLCCFKSFELKIIKRI